MFGIPWIIFFLVYEVDGPEMNEASFVEIMDILHAGLLAWSGGREEREGGEFLLSEYPPFPLPMALWRVAYNTFKDGGDEAIFV